MEYDSILRKIEEAQWDESVINLYRYNGLMQAIDFFSNRLNIDQIVSSAFEFVNELLTVSKSVMYILEDGKYVLHSKRGIDGVINELPMNQRLKTFAMFCGAVISNKGQLEEYFDRSFIDFYRAQIMFPLTMDTVLEGFILLIEKNTGAFVPNDLIMCETLMRIFAGALENNRRLMKLQQINKELDEKIFNLFAINQSSRILLCEHDMDMLQSLSLDMFSELTQSSRTSFFLYDDGAEKYVLKAYKDIYLSKIRKDTVSLTLNSDARTDPMKTLICTDKPEDIEYFNQLFEEGIDILDFSKPLYIVILIQDTGILGFVTLSTTVSGEPYKSSMFELVQSLASYTYIAISNGILLRRLNEHKRLLQEKLDRLQSLNRLMKNINSAEDLETLEELIMTTLDVSFGVEKGALALFQPESKTLNMVFEVGFTVQDKEIILNPYWEKMLTGSIILETDQQKVHHYIGKDMDEKVGEKTGLLAVPVYLEKYEFYLLGAILVYKFRNGHLSDEENLIVMETIANLSAPILCNFMSLEYERQTLEINYKQTFRREFERQVTECKALDIPLMVLHIKTAVPLFEENKLVSILGNELDMVYPVEHNRIMAIVIQDLQCYRQKVTDIVNEYGASVTFYTMGEDFSCCEDFFSLVV
jgi:hypothetical protein